MGKKGPFLATGLERDELELLVDDIAEIVERYQPGGDTSETLDDQLFTWQAMYDELVELLRNRGVPLDLEGSGPR